MLVLGSPTEVFGKSILEVFLGSNFTIFHGTQCGTLTTSLYWWLAAACEKENRLDTWLIGCMALFLHIKLGTSQECAEAWKMCDDECELGLLPPWGPSSWNPTQPASFRCFLLESASSHHLHTLADFLPRYFLSSIWHALHVAVNTLIVCLLSKESKPHKGKALSNLFLLLYVLS